MIEDAAQAIGAEYKGRRAGSMGRYGCFSFFPSKNLGAAGDGGLVTTGDDAVAENLRVLRDHGQKPRYCHSLVGGNFRFDALQAAVVAVKLKYLDRWTAGRQANAARYRRLFAAAGLAEVSGTSHHGETPPHCNGGALRAAGQSLPSPTCGRGAGSEGLVQLPVEIPGYRHIYNQFVIRVPRRDELQAHLAQEKIGCAIYYPIPLHMQKCFAYLGHREGEFPESERAARETLALPIYPELSDQQAERVVECIGGFLTK